MVFKALSDCFSYFSVERGRMNVSEHGNKNLDQDNPLVG